MSEAKAVALHASRFKSAEHVREVWDVVPDTGTPFEALLQPDYWVHIAKYLKPWSRIEVRAEDGSYFAELIVRESGRLFAVVDVLRKVELGKAKTPAVTDPEFTVEYAGPHHKWRVIRSKDKTVMEKGFETKEAAELWRLNHNKALAA